MISNTVPVVKNMAPPRERTFQYQDQLPSLPVPQLHQTINKYLESVRAVASETEYQKTRKIAQDFMKGEGVTLQNLLLERAKNQKNWLEEWWEDYAYLYPRYPVHPFVNFGGSTDCKYGPDPATFKEDPVKVMAQHMNQTAKYYLDMRRENVRVMKSRGTVWCMDQVYRFLNAYRMPLPGKDRIDHYFKLECEGPCPMHIMVMCRGHMWKINPFDSKGVPLKPSKLEEALRVVHDASRRQLPRVSTMTCGEREHWAKARQHLASISPGNAQLLQDIETAISVFSFSEQEPKSYTQTAIAWIRADPSQVWADKSMTYMVHKNGIISNFCCHSNVDAIVTMVFSAHLFQALKTYKEQDDKDSSEAAAFFEEKNFDVDDQVLKDIDIAEKECKQYTSDLDVIVVHFTDYTNELFRSLHIYGDTVVQIALQLAYFRMHSKPAPTYETASTRKYWHGRTETVRSCTPQALQFSKCMMNPDSSDQEKETKFRAACVAHDAYMNDATEGRGCDRHLFGLRIVAKLNGFDEPEIFRDPAFKMSGGDGNYVLSTSFIGYSDIYGGVAPMCSNGYGVFYKMNNDKITMLVSCFKSNPETNVYQFEESIRWALNCIRPYLHAYSLKTMTAKKQATTSKL